MLDALQKHADMWLSYRVAEMEARIGSGLIEEVVQVAEGELKLVDIMAKSKP